MHKKRSKLSHRLFTRHLDEGERILDIAHRHVLVLKLKSAKVVFFGIAVPVFLYLLFPKLLIVFIFWVFIGVLGFIYHFIDWYFDVWLMTTHGVIDIDRNGFFDRSSTRIDYHMIEGISYTVKGVIPTIFNYGKITIDKIGSKTSVVLEDAANPRNVERIVSKYQERFVNDKSTRDHNTLKTMLSEMIAYHVQNNKITPPE